MNAYSVMIAIGAGVGLAQVYRQSPPKQAERWLNAALLALFASLLGARAGFVTLRWGYFSAHPLEIPQLWLGGLAWPGAVLGALLALVILSAAWRTPLSGLVDALAPLALPLGVFAWLASWQAGSAYGAALPNGTWWGIPVRDETGALATRWPLQPLAALALVAAFALLSLWKKKLVPGQRGCLAGLALALDLLLFSFFLAAPAPRWQGLRPETWAALVLALLCAAGLLLFKLQARKRLL